jgi:hypothetical protein
MPPIKKFNACLDPEFAAGVTGFWTVYGLDIDNFVFLVTIMIKNSADNGIMNNQD